MTRVLSLVALVCSVAVAQPGKPDAKNSPNHQPAIRYVENGSGVVGVNPAQPYRPIPVGRAGKPRETIFDFYLRVLNPRRINWGDEIDRRMARLHEQSTGNPYFRLAAVQSVVIVLLLMVCWAWWDKARRIKWIAAQGITDALNLRLHAEARAIEAIEQHNRHMESCTRAIEGQASGIGQQSNDEYERRIQRLQGELQDSKAECEGLKDKLKQSDDSRQNFEKRVAALESQVVNREREVADLSARVVRAESGIAAGKSVTGKPAGEKPKR